MKNKKDYLIVCVWVRPVARAVAAVEVVIVLISVVLLIFGLWIQEIEQLQHIRTEMAVIQLENLEDSQELAGTWTPRTCHFHSHSGNFLTEK